ncbi:MAG: Mrp/NBP35 family ATP-binding protein [Propionibacteriaceae bacterium]|nr:Mrp/NBP35 family ATP-binding protein [Propionibacteriaceae bacterium]
MTQSAEHRLAGPVRASLHQVEDPELRRPITDLGMVDDIAIDDLDQVKVRLLLTTGGCPLRERLTADVRQAVLAVPGVSTVEVEVGVMSPEQRQALRDLLSDGGGQRDIPFTRPDNLTRVIAVASGKGGVGKSSITANLACALASLGLKVGLLDADVYGHSIPDLMGIEEGQGPTQVEGLDMILPVTVAGVEVISIGLMKPDRDQVVAWRGPVVDRSIAQFLTDVYWGDLDFLLIDLPPGTGDVAIGLGQKLPNAEVLVVTTPQVAATEVAERAGTMAGIMQQRVIGVIENMSYLELACPHCGQAQRIDLFGTGGGQAVAERLTQRLGYDVPLVAQIPLQEVWRTASDQGAPLVGLDPSQPAAAALIGLAELLASQRRGLAGFKLGLAPVD